MDLTTRATEVFIVIKRLPEGQEGFLAGLGPRVDQDDYLGVQDAAEAIEEPSVGIDLLAVLLLQTKDELDGWKIGRFVALWPNQLLAGGDRQLSGVFKLTWSALDIEKGVGE